MYQKAEVGSILRGFGKLIETTGFNSFQLRTLSALRSCRTSELGGHVDACTACGTVRISYNSCRNRHCPKCQGSKREEWIEARKSELLPVPYFHLVFTLPEELNRMCMQYPKALYGMLFKSAWETLRMFAGEKGMKTGMVSVLHTWGQNLGLHPHLHCIVPSGGISKQKAWKHISTEGKYLFPVKALSMVFRAKYVSHLRKSGLASQPMIDLLFANPWVVYARRPFVHPWHVVEYLGRYTHKVAISNSRIISYENRKVRFYYKDYRHGGIKKEMELDDTEFIRRFALHILPQGFVRIRHYGILSSTTKREAIPCIREQMTEKKNCFVDRRNIKSYDPVICPCCGKPAMLTVEIIPSRGPPKMETGKYPQKTLRQTLTP